MAATPTTPTPAPKKGANAGVARQSARTKFSVGTPGAPDHREHTTQDLAEMEYTNHPYVKQFVADHKAQHPDKHRTFTNSLTRNRNSLRDDIASGKRPRPGATNTPAPTTPSIATSEPTSSATAPAAAPDASKSKSFTRLPGEGAKAQAVRKEQTAVPNRIVQPAPAPLPGIAGKSQFESGLDEMVHWATNNSNPLNDGRIAVHTTTKFLDKKGNADYAKSAHLVPAKDLKSFVASRPGTTIHVVHVRPDANGKAHGVWVSGHTNSGDSGAASGSIHKWGDIEHVTPDIMAERVDNNQPLTTRGIIAGEHLHSHDLGIYPISPQQTHGGGKAKVAQHEANLAAAQKALEQSHTVGLAKARQAMPGTLRMHMDVPNPAPELQSDSEHQIGLLRKMVKTAGFPHEATAEGGVNDPLSLRIPRVMTDQQQLAASHVQGLRDAAAALDEHLASDEHRAALNAVVKAQNDLTRAKNVVNTSGRASVGELGGTGLRPRSGPNEIEEVAAEDEHAGGVPTSLTEENAPEEGEEKKPDVAEASLESLTKAEAPSAEESVEAEETSQWEPSSGDMAVRRAVGKQSRHETNVAGLRERGVFDKPVTALGITGSLNKIPGAERYTAAHLIRGIALASMTGDHQHIKDAYNKSGHIPGLNWQHVISHGRLSPSAVTPVRGGQAVVHNPDAVNQGISQSAVAQMTSHPIVSSILSGQKTLADAARDHGIIGAGEPDDLPSLLHAAQGHIQSFESQDLSGLVAQHIGDSPRLWQHQPGSKVGGQAVPDRSEEFTPEHKKLFDANVSSLSKALMEHVAPEGVTIPDYQAAKNAPRTIGMILPGETTERQVPEAEGLAHLEGVWAEQKAAEDKERKAQADITKEANKKPTYAPNILGKYHSEEDAQPSANPPREGPAPLTSDPRLQAPPAQSVTDLEIAGGAIARTTKDVETLQKWNERVAAGGAGETLPVTPRYKKGDALPPAKADPVFPKGREPINPATGTNPLEGLLDFNSSGARRLRQGYISGLAARIQNRTDPNQVHMEPTVSDVDQSPAWTRLRAGYPDAEEVVSRHLNQHQTAASQALRYRPISAEKILGVYDASQRGAPVPEIPDHAKEHYWNTVISHLQGVASAPEVTPIGEIMKRGRVEHQIDAYHNARHNHAQDMLYQDWVRTTDEGKAHLQHKVSSMRADLLNNGIDPDGGIPHTLAPSETGHKMYMEHQRLRRLMPHLGVTELPGAQFDPQRPIQAEAHSKRSLAASYEAKGLPQDEHSTWDDPYHHVPKNPPAMPDFTAQADAIVNGEAEMPRPPTPEATPPDPRVTVDPSLGHFYRKNPEGTEQEPFGAWQPVEEMETVTKNGRSVQRGRSGSRGVAGIRAGTSTPAVAPTPKPKAETAELPELEPHEVEEIRQHMKGVAAANKDLSDDDLVEYMRNRIQSKRESKAAKVPVPSGARKHRSYNANVTDLYSGVYRKNPRASAPASGRSVPAGETAPPEIVTEAQLNREQTEGRVTRK